MTRFLSISSVALACALARSAAPQGTAGDAPLAEPPEIECSMDFSPVAMAIQRGEIDAAQETMTRLVPLLPRAPLADDAHACRASLGQWIELAKIQRFATSEATVVPISETGQKALDAARELFRQGQVVPMGNVLASAAIAESELAATPQFRLLQADHQAASEAARLLEDERFDAALRALAAIVVADPLNAWARTNLEEARTGFVSEFPARVLQRNASLSVALLMEPRELAARDQILAAWHELESIPFDESDADVAEVRQEIATRAEAKAREAIGHILEGYREEWIPPLEDAAAALDTRAPVHLYLALAYYGRYLETLATDADLLERARTSIARALEIDRGVEPPRKFFTPQMLELIKDVRLAQGLEPVPEDRIR